VWSTVLAMAVIGIADPVRIGVSAFLLSRSRPVPLLVTFFVVGFAINMAVGAAVLAAGGAMLRGGRSIPGQFEIAIGLALLACGAFVGSGLPARLISVARGGRPDPAAVPPDLDAGAPTVESLPLLSRLPHRVKTVLRGESVWVAAALGLCMGSPAGPHYLAALAAILTSGGNLGAQLGALAVFNLAGFTSALVPIFSFWVAPQATRDTVDQAYAWLRINHRPMMTIILGAVGLIFVVMGAGHL
jgi:hypothetical protein